MKHLFRVAFLGLVTLTTTVHAGDAGRQEVSKGTPPVEDDFPYTKGTKELGLGVATFGSLGTKGTAERPDVGFILGEVRLGVMLYTPSGNSCLRGNVEVLVEGFAGDIFSGPGNAMAGGELLLRYNFVQRGARIVPFFQIGGGGVWSDAAYQDSVQHLLGSNWSWNLGGELGGRIHLSRNTALELGIEYRHMSNADTAERNRGLNSLGGQIGFNWFF